MRSPKLLPVLLLFMLFVLSCSIDRDKAVDRERFTFKTGDDTELFFRNVRQSDYDLEVNDAAKFNMFRHRDRNTSDTSAVLNLAIVINIMQDEAYLMIEPSEVLSQHQGLVILKTENEVVDTMRLQTQNRQTYLEFATQVYEGIQSNARFHTMVGNKSVPILMDKTEREVFRITVGDYYRLTRIY